LASQSVSLCLFSVGYGYRSYTIGKSNISYVASSFSYYKEYILAFSDVRDSVQMRSNLEQIYNPLSHNNTKN